MLAALALAARSRRLRETRRTLWRVAPVVSAISLAAAVVVRWRHAPALIPLGLLAAAAVVWVLYAFVQRRRVRVSDATASAIDEEAGLAGELRSAAWFASRDVADSWTGLHLSRAADRLESLDLSHLYPALRARRARVATFVMAAIAVLLVTPLPGRPQAVAPPPNAQSAPPPRAVQPIALEGVPAELPQELEALLTAIENGTFAARQPEADAAFQAMLAQIHALNDPRALTALVRAMADRDQADDSDASRKALADRVKRDAALTPPSEIRDALEALSKKLSDSERDTDSAGLEKSDDAQPDQGVDLAGTPPESARDASAIASLGMVTLSSQAPADPNAPPGVGVGGSSSSPGNAGTMADIAKTLRHEIIEANEDDVSGNVQTDARRKTERGSATTTFTRSAAASFDGTHASAPPPVPEARRARTQTYFSRKQ